MSYFLYSSFYQNSINKNSEKQTVIFIKKEKSIKLFDLVKELEEYININNLEVKNLKIASKSIIMNIEGDFINSVKIIDYVQKYSSYLDIKRVSFEALPDNKIDLNVEVKLTKRVNYYKKQVPKEISSDTLYQKYKQTIEKESNNKQVQISAIIGKSVLVGDTWYKVGNIINNKKIVLIKSDHIALEQEGNIKKIWMYNNDFTR
ncbi:MAG: hypothetical protein ACNI28_02975 [Arcobacter sp.]|uniref:hypothetical protein n=1 Tax=Arcobacter sp. TaxID=1872629 RepID=UPI003AFF9B6D